VAETEDQGFKVTGNLSVIMTAVLMSLGGGSSLYASHSSLSSKIDLKLDAVIAAQTKIETEIAEIRGANVAGTVRELDVRMRSLEEKVAALEVSAHPR
jgi:hypothetical protein